MTDVSEKIFRLKDSDSASSVMGEQDRHIKIVENIFQVRILARGLECLIQQTDRSVEGAENALEHLALAAQQGIWLKPYEIDRVCRMIARVPEGNFHFLYSNPIVQNVRNENVLPKTLHQYEFIQTIREKDVSFGWGPAGTGKSFLAVAMAVAMLQKKEVQRIILTRPAVEAGEKLGFLPGDLEAKINPFLRPLLDALKDLMDVEKVNQLIEKGVIEIAPLAYMRGRTLNNSFIILDEAQNTSPAQMKMFLTRLGFGSKAVITGDITQIDLPAGQTSGLVHAIHVLRHIKEVEFVEFDSSDVVRHSIVQKIIDAYERKPS